MTDASRPSLSAMLDVVARLAWVARVGAVELALGVVEAVGSVVEDAMPGERRPV